MHGNLTREKRNTTKKKKRVKRSYHKFLSLNI